MTAKPPARATPRRPARAPAVPAQPDTLVAAIRRFNRFYTRWVGALDEGFLESPFSLAEARIVYELANRHAPTATELRRDLQLDAGYLSRLLASLVRRRFVRRVKSTSDARHSHLQLTQKGADDFAELNQRASGQLTELLQPMSAEHQRRLVDAMATIETLLSGTSETMMDGTGTNEAGTNEPRAREVQVNSATSGTAGTSPTARHAPSPLVLRPAESGDYGWIVERHGVLYAREFGWDETFEGIVAGIVAHYLEHREPRRERCWIAELNGERAGSIFLEKHPEQEAGARLRLLLVEPSARGHGVGRQLVDECVRQARRSGFRTMSLWTMSTLVSARKIYEHAGFRLVREEPVQKFGKNLTSESWELTL